MGEPRLLEVGGDDWQLWRSLRLRCLAEAPDAFGSTLAREQAFDEPAWRARVGRGSAVIAELDGRPLGMAGLFHEAPGLVSVVSMWVAPEARGLGIGRRLLDHVVAAAPSSARVRLWVSDTQPAARRLYERAGFVATGAREPLRSGSAVLKSELELRR